MGRRYRGVVVLVATAVAVGAWVLVTEPLEGPAAAPPAAATAATDLGSMPLPEEVVPWSVAEARGQVDEIDWGDRCDRTTGALALPYLGAVPCVAPFVGDNGGATATGVSATTVDVVVYQPNPDDPLTALVSQMAGAAGDARAAFAARQGFVELFGRYFETYGRTVRLRAFQGSGAASDPVSAVADAETVARDLRPFMVIGGPLLTAAFADTLAARGIMCWQCAPGEANSFYVDRGPYVWDLLKNPEQNGLMVDEYIGRRLAGRPARWAGDPAMRNRERVFGSLHLSLGPGTAEIEDRLRADLERYGVGYAAEATFEDPTAVDQSARELITRFKEAGVTTVVYTGDPLAPATLTRVATEQDYFPEWVITGTALIDTNVLARTYDQRQWAHAFGPANLFVGSRRPSAVSELWRWYHGTEPPVSGSSLAAVVGPLQVLYLVLQLVGPDLDVAAFGRTLFTAPTLEGSPTLGQISFGTRLWPEPDYSALDDQAEVWWDPTARGVDELGQEGAGMWRWVDGGRRVLPGAWPSTEPDVFDPATAITVRDDPPWEPSPYVPLH